MPRWRRGLTRSASSSIRPVRAMSRRNGRQNWPDGFRRLSMSSASSSTKRRKLSTLPAEPCRSASCSFMATRMPTYCRQFSRPYLRAARVRPGLDLVEFAGSFPDARGLLLDAFVEGYGGGGHVFDWTLIPLDLPGFLVLSGGLTAANVGDAIERVRPVAVDVSSGVEMSKGIKDHSKIAAFVAAVRKADESI